MKKTKFLRIAAFTLALIFVFAGGAVAVSANNSSSSSSMDSDANVTTSDIQELLNTISYEKYYENLIGAEIEQATEDIVLTGDAVTKGFEYTLRNGAKPAEGATDVAKPMEENGKAGLYIPGTGVVTWTIPNVEKAARYVLVIEYYPVQSKATPIEKVLLINGEVPFAEARQMVIEKKWVTSAPYCDLDIVGGKIGEKSVAKVLEEAKASGVEAIETTSTIGGETKKIVRFTMPTVWNEKITAYVESMGLRFFKQDIDLNEIRSGAEEAPDWFEYTFVDANGFMQDPFEIALIPDANKEVTISLRSENEPIIISSIRLEAPEKNITYKEYKASHKGAPQGTGVLKIEAEYFGASSSQTIYPISDGTSAISSPAAFDRTVLNTVGGNKWQSAGQWIEYSFTVSSTGMYQIVPRFKQNLLDGMYVSRALYLYGGEYNGIPFDEANRLTFNYSTDWQAAPLGTKNEAYEFYFEEGETYKMRFEVNLGEMGDIVRRVQNVLNAINSDYLEIMKLTGANPDQYRDYGFYRIMPNTMNDLYIQAAELGEIREILEKSAAVKSSNTATLEKVERLLYDMFYDENKVAQNLEQLKTYIGSLGTWISDAKTQPLLVDYINIQPASAELPKAKANFFAAILFELQNFFKSFFRHYDRMGAMTETDEEETVEVWLAYGRDQSQVIRELINNDFTSGKDGTNIPVNLKLVSAGTLLPSILSGQGPDVYIGLAQVDVINYAIRGALISLDDLPETYDADKNKSIAMFEKEAKQTADEYYAEYKASQEDFNEAAMQVMKIAGSDNIEHCYGLPETQNFNMMFVREDIMAQLNLEIPKTWDDVKAAIPVLQANNMQIGMHQDVKIFLYQNGGELFADDGMRINLDSNVALDSFTTMCDFFTMYSFPYKYDFANRFRTGEMPIGFATYTATYNQLKVFATEIEGMWSMYPMPGVMQADGTIKRDSVSTATAIVMIIGAENKHDSWEFIKWHVDDRCQTDYSNEMVAILGPSAKHATANESALESMPWTVDEIAQIKAQFNELASIPNYPGSYIVDRYLKFAFLDAYDDNMDPAKALESYVAIINKEIERKRIEFDLEILTYGDESCPTLANKRLRQAEDELNKNIDAIPGGKNGNLYKNIMKLINGYNTEDYATLGIYADELEASGNKKLDKAIEYMRDAEEALKIYENYK